MNIKPSNLEFKTRNPIFAPLKTAVVILNWNGKQLLEKFLPGVVAFSSEAAIYVADNASTDDSVSYIEENFPSVKIIRNKINGGYAKGYNDALKHVNAEIYVLLNSDVEVTENWLSPVISHMAGNPDIAVAQPKILDYTNRNHFEYAGAAGGFIDKFGYPYCRGRIFNSIEEDKGQYDDIVDIFWASGACFFIKATEFNLAGGFDEDYFAHQEEIDLCWRLKNKGKRVAYIGTSRIYHVGGATLKNSSPKKSFLNFRNSLFSLVKNIPRHNFYFILLIRMLLDGVAGLHFLITFKFAHFLAVLKAHFYFYGKYFVMLSKRQNKTYLSRYYGKKSIVFSYFVKNKKIYKF